MGEREHKRGTVRPRIDDGIFSDDDEAGVVVVGILYIFLQDFEVIKGFATAGAKCCDVAALR